jgi:hypothetical protein
MVTGSKKSDGLVAGGTGCIILDGEIRKQRWVTCYLIYECQNARTAWSGRSAGYHSGRVVGAGPGP